MRGCWWRAFLCSSSATLTHPSPSSMSDLLLCVQTENEGRLNVADFIFISKCYLNYLQILGFVWLIDLFIFRTCKLSSSSFSMASVDILYIDITRRWSCTAPDPREAGNTPPVSSWEGLRASFGGHEQIICFHIVGWDSVLGRMARARVGNHCSESKHPSAYLALNLAQT